MTYVFRMGPLVASPEPVKSVCLPTRGYTQADRQTDTQTRPVLCPALGHAVAKCDVLLSTSEPAECAFQQV